MKTRWIWLLAAVGLLAVSCMKEQVEAPADLRMDLPKITATAAAESPATKVSVGAAVDNQRPVTWDKGDAISVFYRNKTNLKFALEGEGGSASGVFAYASGFGAGVDFPQVYAAYPYDKDVKMEDGYLWVTVPAEQAYTENGFDPKANVMVGVSKPGANMAFKNLGGYLVLKFYGEDAEVSSITVEGAMGEQIAGPVLVGIEEGNLPWIEEWGAASETVTLVAKEPVKVGATADEATEFWLVMMPETFMDGFTVTVECNDGTFTKTLYDSFQVVRSQVNRMDPLQLTLFDPNAIIEFKDADLKAHLVECGVDTDGDGEISCGEAAAVTSLEGIFEPEYYDDDTETSYPFTSFDEFEFFIGISEIAEYQFEYWESLESIKFPPSLREIPNGAFGGCRSLKGVEFPSSITAIGSNAFGGCYSLAALDIPGSVKTIGGGAFGGDSGIKTIIFRDGIETIASSAIGGCSGVESIVFPSTIKTLPSCGGFYSLKEVVLPYGIEEIPSGSFGGCYQIKELDFPGSVKTIPSGLLGGLTNLKTVIFEEGIQTIGNCFGGNSKLEKIVFPSTVATLPSGLCSGISSLKEIVLPSGIQSLGSGAFSGCTALTEVDIPGSVESLGSQVFSDCTSLKSVTMHAGTKTIGNANFTATALESFTFPGTIENVPSSNFSDCSKLMSVDLKGVKTLDGGSFTGLPSLKSVTMYEGMETINAAFGGSGLTSVVIPASVQKITGGAFNTCSDMTSVTFLGTTPPEILSGAFGVASGCKFYVPAAALEAYTASAGLSSFVGSIVPVD